MLPLFLSSQVKIFRYISGIGSAL